MMTAKAPLSITTSFKAYPRTQAALKTLQLQSECAARSTARILQLMARQPIEGDFALTAAEVEHLEQNPNLTRWTQQVLEIFMSEQHFKEEQSG
jgi:hypothetical protein